MTLMERQGRYGKCVWRQLVIITDARVVIVEMVPALLSGWNVARVTVQSGDDWEGYTEAGIVAFKGQFDELATLSPVSSLSASLVSRLAESGVTL